MKNFHIYVQIILGPEKNAQFWCSASTEHAAQMAFQAIRVISLSN